MIYIENAARQVMHKHSIGNTIEKVLILFFALPQRLKCSRPLGLGPLLSDDLPRHIGQVGDDLYVFLCVFRWLVAHCQDGNHLVLPHHRHHQLTDQFSVSFRHALFVRQRGIIIVNHRFFLVHTVHPDTGFIDAIMHSPPLSLAEFLQRASGPLLQGKGLFVRPYKAIKPDGAIHERPCLVQSAGQKFIQSVGGRVCDERKARLGQALVQALLALVAKDQNHAGDISLRVKHWRATISDGDCSATF